MDVFWSSFIPCCRMDLHFQEFAGREAGKLLRQTPQYMDSRIAGGRRMPDNLRPEPCAQGAGLRVSNTIKHACVAARIGDDAKRGAGNMSILANRATKSTPILAAPPCGLARVFAHGFVASPFLSRSKRRALLRALSQNRASASRVLSC